jgi:hypothetical protein
MFTYINYTFGVINRGGSRIYSKGGGALKKIAPSGGRREHVWGISCEKSRIYAKKNHIFSNFRGGGARAPPPPGSTPDQHFNLNEMVTKLNLHLSFKLIDERIHAKISET